MKKQIRAVDHIRSNQARLMVSVGDYRHPWSVTVGVKMRPWTEDELKRARDMRAAGCDYREIDMARRRRAGSTQRQFESAEVGSKYVPAGLLAEREALAAAREQRTLTQGFCGDPPPGYSALDGKTGQR